MKKDIFYYLTTAVGLLLLGIGLYMVKTITEAQGIIHAIPYVCVGIGCGVFGHGMGNVISSKAMKGCPEAVKQMEININDERNIAISNRAKAKSYDMMIFIFGALMMSFAIMKIDLVIVLLFVCSYLFVVGYGVFYRCKYEKEM